jgi:hypothetical protein
MAVRRERTGVCKMTFHMFSTEPPPCIDGPQVALSKLKKAAI